MGQGNQHHWINFYGDYSTAECSQCGYLYTPEGYEPSPELFHAFRENYHFCPHCGAEMVLPGHFEIAWSLGYSGYLLWQESDSGWDYSVYDSRLNLLDGGQLDYADTDPNGLNDFRTKLLTDLGMDTLHRMEIDCDLLREKLCAAGK